MCVCELANVSSITSFVRLKRRQNRFVEMEWSKRADVLAVWKPLRFSVYLVNCINNKIVKQYVNYEHTNGGSYELKTKET